MAKKKNISGQKGVTVPNVTAVINVFKPKKRR